MIFLVGMPGAGKTFWGRKIADAYAWHFTDLDTFIEKKERATISTIFELDGEHGFREKEHAYLGKLIASQEENTIIACGGGTPCYFDNMDVMLQAGIVIYLQAGIDQLVNNLQQEQQQRPLLRNTANLHETLTQLLQAREHCYLRATHILQTENISLTTFGKILDHV